MVDPVNPASAPEAPEVETESVVPASEFHVPQIHRSIVEAMSRLRKIAKKRETTGGERFSYRGIEDAMAALQPVLIDVGLHINMHVVSVHYDVKESQKGNAMTVCFMQMRFELHSIKDGSFISSEVASEGVDVSDKASNKALSNCLKYWIFQLFMIPTSELKDSEGDTPPKDDGFKPNPKGGKAPPRTPPHPGEGKAPPPPPPKPPAVVPYLFKVGEESFTISGAYAKTVNDATSLQQLQQAFAEGMLKAKEQGVPDDEMFSWDFQWSLEEAKLGVLVLRARVENAYRAKKAAQEGAKA